MANTKKSNKASDKKTATQKLKESRQRLLDLTLRNRLLNFRPGNPRFQDDSKSHKHIVLKGKLELVWQTLVSKGDPAEILGLTPEQLQRLVPSSRHYGEKKLIANTERPQQAHDEIWEDFRNSTVGVGKVLERGDLIALMPEGILNKRLSRIRNEQNTLLNSTGDSALFLSLGFLEWSEPEPHPKAGEPLFSPLVLIHVQLENPRNEGGGERRFFLKMDSDQPQGNPCLLEKFKQDFSFDIPDLNTEEETAESYLNRISRAIRSKKNWKVHDTICLGFFNFARYRLWLDLNPDEWPKGQEPSDHPVVVSVLNGDPMPGSSRVPTDEEVAEHQIERDLHIVMDADSTQYATLVTAHSGESLVIQGPPGSGKSQTITNLISIALEAGQKVLFVAQKLPALKVVQRRLESVGLSPYCLPLFSDKARVSEVHKHFRERASLRGIAQSNYYSKSSALAENLNRHANCLRDKPSDFTDSVCAILQKAAGLRLSVEEIWGSLWSNSLLEVTIPDVEPSTQWFEEREQKLVNCHRIEHEIGDVWFDWNPVLLTEMDIQVAGFLIGNLSNKAKLLSELALKLPSSSTLPFSKLETWAIQVEKSRLCLLPDPLLGLIDFLWKKPEHATQVSKLERLLEYYQIHSEKARLTLRVTRENRENVLSSVSKSLSFLQPIISSKHSLASTHTSLDSMLRLLWNVEKAITCANMNIDGVSSLAEISQIGFLWKQLLQFGAHNPPLPESMPLEYIPELAFYVAGNNERHNEAAVLSDLLNQRARLSSELGPHLVARTTDAEDLKDVLSLHPILSFLMEQGFVGIQILQMDQLQQQLKQTRSVLDSCIALVEKSELRHSLTRETPATFWSEIGGLIHQHSSVFFLPKNGIEQFVQKHPDPVNLADQLSTIGQLTAQYDDLHGRMEDSGVKFPRGADISDSFIKCSSEIQSAISVLRLEAITAGEIDSIILSIESLQDYCETAISHLEATYKFWPLLAPTTLPQFRKAKTLLSLLLNKPQAPEGLAVAPLFVASNRKVVREAIEICEELNQISKEKTSVRFSALPKLATLNDLAKTLRHFNGNVLRWFYPEYRETTRVLRIFICEPLPNAESTIALLDELCTYVKRQEALLCSPARLILGHHFNGTETNWEAIQPTISWVVDLKSVTNSNDITGFVQSRTESAAELSVTLGCVERLLQAIENNRGRLSSVPVLEEIVSNPDMANEIGFFQRLKSIGNRLRELAAWIQRNKIPGDFQLSQTGAYFDTIRQLQISTNELKQFGHIASSDQLLKPRPEDFEETAVWLRSLVTFCPDRSIAEALIRGRIIKEDLPISECHIFANLFAAIRSEFRVSWNLAKLNTSELRALLVRTESEIQVAQECFEKFRLNSDLSIQGASRAVEDVVALSKVIHQIAPWAKILNQDIDKLSSDIIGNTLAWVREQEKRSVDGKFLKWILSGKTESRIKWWCEMADLSASIVESVRDLKASFTELLAPDSINEPVKNWYEKINDFRELLQASLDTLVIHSQSEKSTLAELTEAITELNRSSELESRVQQWRDCLGCDPLDVPVDRLQNHRQWITATRDIGQHLGDWLCADDLSQRCSLLLSLKTKIDEIRIAHSEAKSGLEWFGQLKNTGPFHILSLNGTPEVIASRCEDFLQNLPTLPAFADLRRNRADAIKFGLGTFIERVRTPGISADHIVDTFRAAVAFQQARNLMELNTDLKFFKPLEHERIRVKFQEYDEDQLGINRRAVRARLSNNLIDEGNKGKKASEHTELALLKHEFGKKQKHLPIRQLVSRAGRAMQDLCPCWMMTPLAVAQFLQPGEIKFDLIIMDEASQINPEDAWGVIARGTQLVVVGDHKQMPPSDFFETTLGGDEDGIENEEIDGGRSESILEAAVPALLTSELLWHYRSRHEALIAPANRFSYFDKLVLFPHPQRSNPELGIRYTFIERGISTTGKVTNVQEAKAIAVRIQQLVLHEYAKPDKERLSIGVVTMNLAQQDCIEDILDVMRNDNRNFDRALAAMSNTHLEEPFFVRNLENIQGDERDIIMISCTYAPHTLGGTPTQRFGPLNREGGERRFNVLITRAKWRMEVFASLRSNQILCDEKKQGVLDFHRFLKYAETGSLPDPGVVSERPHDSPFELQVEAVLRKEGFEVARQVGVAGYFIDLAVEHPHQKGVFALGIECDGMTYHSSRGARDRDRLREKVLLERGWELHRIWSTDWFVNPIPAKLRLLEAVRKACG